MTTSLIKQRQEWQKDVEAHFEEGMAHHKAMSVTDKPRARYKEQLLVSYISDVQEQMLLNPQDAIENLNRIKYMINNCYQERDYE